MGKHPKLFLAACSGMLLFGICLITLGSVAVELKARYSLDGAGAGTLFSLLPFGILTGSLFFGPVCDRYGYKALLIMACLAMWVGFEGIAYAHSLGMLQSYIFLFGVGGGVINGATNALVSDISGERKGADLSLLGVFFGLGALGMPLLLGLLSHRFSPLQVISGIGWLPIFVAAFYWVLPFPLPKQMEAMDTGTWRQLRQPLLLLIAFFLFFQSSLEAIINNWTTTYLDERKVMSAQLALYALSLHIAGMVLMRICTGTLLRAVAEVRILWLSLLLMAVGMFLMQWSDTQIGIICGLFLSGAGLAGGFPIMLGFVGERYAQCSGTAFSFVFTIALIGNMLINYGMGLVVAHYGVRHLMTVSYLEIGIMTLLFIIMLKFLQSNSK